MKNKLFENSRATLVDCERVIDALGFTPTTGAELEWYSLVPEGKPHTSRDEAVAQLVAQARENPEAFFNSKTMLQAAPDTTLRYRRAVRAGTMDPDEAEHLTRLLAHETMRAEFKALNFLLRLNVERHMGRASIFLHKSETEGGEIALPAPMYPGTQNKQRITGEKLEVSTGMTSPTQLAVWLDQMHDIIREESAALGLIADFSSKPLYTYMNERGPLFDAMPGTSQHVHFGLRHKPGGGNAFRTGDEHNELSDRVSQSVLALLKEGGQLLANPQPEDYDRFTKLDWAMSPPLMLGNYRDARQAALREIGDHEDPLGTIQAHKEVRIMGGSTPAPSAVLVPVLGMTDALLSAIGKQAPAQDWQEKTGTSPKLPYLRQVAATITDDDRQKLQKMATTAKPMVERDEGWLHTTFEDSWASLAPTSAIARYSPPLFADLKALNAKGVA